jgi:geranylgeranyl pyrophosphate synthase
MKVTNSCSHKGKPMDFEHALKATHQTMLDKVQSDVQVLQDASRYIISAGGKRVRPRVMFLAYLACGGEDLEEVVPVAAAIELVHTATLVHDDINDHGVTRRGKVTINEQWGRTFALLTGDFLFTQVYSLMAPYKDLNITFAEATVALVEGETLQAQAAKDNNLSREIYQQVVAKKTASLFRAAALLGGQLAEANEHEIDALSDYGFFLGLAFQIVDDLLDLTGDPRLMGKAAGVDLAQGKGVASAVHTNGNGLSSIAEAVAEEKSQSDPLLDIKRKLIAGGAIEEGRQMVKTIASQAETALDKLPQNLHVQEMRALIKLVVNRDR